MARADPPTYIPFAPQVLGDLDALRTILEYGPDLLDRRRTWRVESESGSAWALVLEQGVMPALSSVKQFAVDVWRELERLRRLAGDAALNSCNALPAAPPAAPSGRGGGTSSGFNAHVERKNAETAARAMGNNNDDDDESSRSIILPRSGRGRGNGARPGRGRR